MVQRYPSGVNWAEVNGEIYRNPQDVKVRSVLGVLLKFRCA
jgi:hypothetical protein